MKKEAIVTSYAPSAIGPYSQAIKTAGFLFISGQIPLDPKSGLVVGTTIESQTEQVMKNLSAILKSQLLDFNAVVKTTVFLMDMAQFPKFNEIYQAFLTAPYPARATIQVSRLPKDVLVEIEAIAALA